MKKILKIIIINLLLFLILAVVLEACLFFHFKMRNPEAKYNLKHLDYIESFKFFNPREPVGLNYTKRPIMLLGGSFIYGLHLEGEHTPHYKLSELSKRPVFNYALPGKGLQHSLFVIQNKLYDKRMQNPEYVVYVMIYDHIRRMYSQVMFNDNTGQPIYKITKDGDVKLVHDYFPFYKKFFTLYFINNIYYFKLFYKDNPTHHRNALAYFKAMKKEINKQYPDAKFIILLYDDYFKFGLYIPEFKREGLTVIQTKELTGVNFYSPEYQIDAKHGDLHPTESVWDIVMPALVKELNL